MRVRRCGGLLGLKDGRQAEVRNLLVVHNVGCKSSIKGALQKCWSVGACYTSPMALASGGSQRWPRIKSDSRPASNRSYKQQEKSRFSTQDSEGGIAMRRLVCAVLVLSLEVVGQATAPKGGGSPTGMPYTTAQNWSQNSTTALTAGSSNALTLTPCPLGVDTSGQGMYDVYISDGTSSESVAVNGGTCTSGAPSGTITFTPYFSHASYAIESGSSGIQETINSVCGTNTLHTQNGYCNIMLPAIGHGYIYNRYQVYGTIFFHAYQSVLSGYGTRLECYGRGPCLQVGDLSNSNDYMNNTIEGINFATLKSYSSIPAYEGVQHNENILHFRLCDDHDRQSPWLSTGRHGNDIVYRQL